ncbi:MAG: deoxyguanosinetriphosphate triphosphohydrolase [Candidatus Omnitrophica bacterium]|jgi:dGTPase|nr:deoxyguanosinetriphosphate triphosphohydrolase [Candidatus Omnitrophota bacterium]MDD4012654.1 deoxyguanosinetriphosphate triphosphohydrolase [Candidatus Omnitrophota bacterium]
MTPKILTRREIEDRESALLAPYGMKSGDSRGRVYPEEEHPYRSAYQRDKDRIIYSTAFRRLEYKTQVFVNHEGDYYRTRLTHTLEVAQISRTIAQALKLNEELVEAIALAHDLGHTPFGHSGEDALEELMKDHGGFDHNSHGLRVVDLLEERYPSFPGLNLTAEVRRGIIRHSSPFDLKRMGTDNIQGANLLEIQVVNMADEIAYDNHDLDDGLKSGLLNEDDMSGCPLWSDTAKKLDFSCPGISKQIQRSQMVRNLINIQVSDVIQNSLERIDSFGIRSVNDLEKLNEPVIVFSPEMDEKRSPMRDVLMNKLYKHYRVVRMSNKATRFLKSLFNVYLDDTRQLPPQAQEEIPKRGKYRVVCDYMAGMTDRYALDQYKKFFEPYERV